LVYHTVRATEKIKPYEPEEDKYEPANNLDDLLTPIGNKIPSKVTLSGIPKRQEKSILDGLNNSVVKYSGKLNSVGWQVDRRRSLGVAHFGGQFIRFQKTGTKTIYSKALKEDKWYNERRLALIAKTKQSIEDSRRAGIIEFNKQKLKNLKSATRWSIYTQADDPMKTIALHEGFHNVYGINKLEDRFLVALKKHNVVDKNKWFEVSEYAATNVAELFAEIGSAIESNINIPQKFINAFNDTIKGIKKK